MRNLRKFLSGRRQQVDASASPPRPVPPICVVGDLHGRLDLLERMLDAIDVRGGAGLYRTVFAGDMIDRGPDSAAVLRRLSELSRSAPERVICLMGNHERMMLDFLEDPVRNGPLWLANGGAETLASFGLSPWTRGEGVNSEGRQARLGADLAAAMSGDLVHWLMSLPLVWRDGALVVTHAGADPDQAIEDQTAQTCLWGHPAFLRHPRRDGLWVAHGHTIVPKAYARFGRIAVDTGAWHTNRLSAAWLDEDGPDFIEVQDQ